MQHLQQFLCFTYNTVLRQITLKVCSIYIKKALFLHYTESHTDMQIPGRDSHMKETGMLVVSLRGVNFGFWSRLGCFGQSAKV